MNKEKRVRFYFDGFNFYEGLRSKKWRKYYWLDIIKFCEQFCKPYQKLVGVTYFSAIQYDREKAARQDKFFQANLLNPRFDLILGSFRKRVRWKKRQRFEFWEEKKTDVAIASYMIRDVVLDKCDVTVLVCADGDLTPPIDVIREIKPNHKIFTYFPPNTNSLDLRRKTKFILLERHVDKFENAILPGEIKLNDGFVLKCPEKWK